MPTVTIRPTDDQARQLAQDLLARSRFASLATTDPECGDPTISRIAVLYGPDGHLLTLISKLSAHTRALHVNPRCSLLIGEPGPKGDPLTYPRLSLRSDARFVPRAGSEHPALRDLWLKHRPKAKLYIDFSDFGFVRFMPISADLNGGFGKAFRLAKADLLTPG